MGRFWVFPDACKTRSTHDSCSPPSLRPSLSLLPFQLIWTWFLVPGTVVGVVLYTGRELRSVMNTSDPRSKVRLPAAPPLWIRIDEGTGGEELGSKSALH